MNKFISVESIAEMAIEKLPPAEMKTRIIAIDECGGAGKSTFAKTLSKHFDNCPVIHTDDFASWDAPTSWYPRMLEQVLLPLKKNEPAHYQRYDWAQKKLANWIRVEPQKVIIIEGVTASRKEFRDYLTFVVFVSTDRNLRLKRGLDRDG